MNNHNKSTSVQSNQSNQSSQENSNKPETFVSSLFDNPLSKIAINALSEEEKQRYKQIGEELYNRVNFCDSTIISDITPADEACAYLIEQLKAGLHPSYMDENEQLLMADVFGKTWYVEWGYTEKDLKQLN